MAHLSNTLTIMLLEDEPRVACALAYMITSLGWAIVLVDSVEQARAIFHEHEDLFAIVADYRMNSEKTGLDFLKWAKREREDVRRILISGQDLRRSYVEIQDHCHTFLPKPFEVSDLEAALQ
ncbi:unnamed protein product, partial [Laminaria digitata]